MTKITTLPSYFALLGTGTAGWLLLVGDTSLQELFLGIGCVVLALLINSLAWRHMNLCWSPTLRQGVSFWRLPWYVLSGTWEMFVILVRDVTGRSAGSFYRAAPFRTANGCKGVSQIILATAYTTAAPNFIVIGIVCDTLLFHQVERSGVPRLLTDLEETR